MNNAASTHVFERTGLGQAPFRFVCAETVKFQACPGAPVQCGGSCDYCGTPIMRFYWIADATGRQFKVGSECAFKAGDAGITRAVTEEQRKTARIANRDKKRREALRIWNAWNQFDEVRASLSAQPHPQGYVDRETGEALTLADWARWMMANGQHSARLKVARLIEKTLKNVTS